MNTRRTKKQTYSSREVSQITSLKPYVLRYWETEFEELCPKKSRNGKRSYRLDDIILIFQIKKLLYEDKYTIAGARQRLKALRKSGEQMDFSFERLRKEDAVFEIKKGLQEILVLLDQHESSSRNVTVVEARKRKESAKTRSKQTVNVVSNGMHLIVDTIAH